MVVVSIVFEYRPVVLMFHSLGFSDCFLVITVHVMFFPLHHRKRHITSVFSFMGNLVKVCMRSLGRKGIYIFPLGNQ
jgi:hypothetical protein